MGKRIMHSARALFLTFLALEKSKRNSTSHEDCPTAEQREGWQKIYSGKIVPQQCNCSGTEGGKVGKRSTAEKLCRSSATAAERKVGKRSTAEKLCRSSATAAERRAERRNLELFEEERFVFQIS
jgi:hypothetical protein